MAVDLLSDVLAMVRLTGALIYRVDIHAPWGVAAHPTLKKFARVLPSGTNQIMGFHVVLDGACWVRHDDAAWKPLHAGEAVVMTRGDPHGLCDAPGRKLVPMIDLLDGREVLDVRHARIGDPAGRPTRLLCGFLGCDRHAFEPLFHALPASFIVSLGASLDALVRYAVTDALDDRPGAASLRVRLAELLFTETLRLHMHTMPADASGWLAALRDPLVGRALHALHAEPCRPWTVEALAGAVASSRSCLATRFREMIGEPPMHYLAGLRMQLAAQHLQRRTCSVAAVAEAVGYESSAAFQRAFKRSFGAPPATWRRNVRTPEN